MSEALHVCVATQQLATVISGPGVHAHNLIAHLLADGHRVSVIAPATERPSGDLPYAFIGVQQPAFNSNQARWASLAWQFGRALADLVRTESFDIVQFTDARESLFCPSQLTTVGNINDTYAADIQSLDYYRTHYSDWFARWAYYRIVRILECIALRRLSAVIANSNYTARVIQERYCIPETRMHVCHKSIEASHFTPALEMRAQMAPHPPRVLLVGGNMQRKGLPTLIRAAPRIVQAVPNIEFWVAGRDAAQPKMEALCRRQGVHQFFHFLGLIPQAELPALYAQCDVFAMPSLTEAFGVVFLEAMASGLPVVGTRVGGVTEIINDGENGLLVPPHDSRALAEAILRLLRDRTLREQLTQAGLTTARSFSVERMMMCTYQVYRDARISSAS